MRPTDCPEGCWYGISTQRCIITRKSADLTGRFDDIGLGLAPHGLIQSNLVWCGPVQCCIYKFKITSHIEVPNVREKTLSCSGVNTVLYSAPLADLLSSSMNLNVVITNLKKDAD
jgi:hypothetical protein